MQEKKQDPLHGITLKMLLNYLLEHYGWDGLYDQIPINCFNNNPSIKSSLTFIRKTPWVRVRLEKTFIYLTRNGLNDEWLMRDEK
jgi:uncharacterized protein (DUF2132 family)